MHTNAGMKHTNKHELVVESQSLVHACVISRGFCTISLWPAISHELFQQPRSCSCRGSESIIFEAEVYGFAFLVSGQSPMILIRSNLLILIPSILLEALADAMKQDTCVLYAHSSIH